MLSRSALVTAFLLATAPLCACTPVTAQNGFLPVSAELRPQDVKVGEDTRTTVMSKLGSPSATGAFDKDTWYYISQTSDKLAYLHPKIKTRTVVTIHFAKDEKVTEVKAIELKDGYDLAYAKRETPTRGRELSWVEQLLGNIGRGGVLPNQDNDPGQRPGGGGGAGRP